MSFDNDKFARLLDFVLIDGKNPADRKAVFKFPNVSAELLSIANPKVLDFFAQEEESGELHNFETLFACFPERSPNKGETEVNYTRAGYVQKILNSLINTRPATFVPAILQRADLVKLMLTHSYCKSIALVLQNLLVLTQPAASQTAGGAPTADGKSESASNGSPAPDICKETLDHRLELFDQVIRASIESADIEAQTDMSANLSNIVMFILSKDFSEKLPFLQRFAAHLDEIIEKFLTTFASPVNNKLGNIFLVFLESFLKENDKDIASLGFPVSKIEAYTSAYFAIAERADQPVLSPHKSQRTLSFATEVMPVNLKLYKVLEALLMIAKHYANVPTFNQAVFQKSAFPKVVFQLLLNHPFNNILHNQVKKFLAAIIESQSEPLHELYFTRNAQFFEFLATIGGDRHGQAPGKRRVQKGFTGHLMSLVGMMLKSEGLKKSLDTNDVWAAFLTGFYEGESERERVVLGDVDVNTDNSESTEPSFFYSLEEIKKRYADFLELSDEPEPGDVDEAVNSSEERPPRSSEENRSSEDLHGETNTPDLLQEIRDLDDHNPEASYTDFTYWKPLIDYSVDDLLNELKS